MNRIMNDILDRKKGKLLVKLWKEKENRIKQRKAKSSLNINIEDNDIEEERINC